MTAPASKLYLEAPRRLRALVRARESSLIVLAAIVGALGGLFVALMSHAVGLLHEVLFNIPHGERLSSQAVLEPMRAVLVPTIGGLLFGLSLLGLRWGQLQWMAAALTVGLGFGLQEIFANFVSGLIVLFERPIRVGDVITIRGIEGTVTRIRTRATTVVDWDNKEVIIPNKTFITDQLTNWTLSDAVTRVVIKVGVAYQSNPEEVRGLLLELGRAHPKVLKEPGPNCWCVALGASTLDFELRVFVGNIFERSAVRNDLHGAVLREFRARGIDICFPQMDVWVREAEKMPEKPLAKAAAAEGEITPAP